MSTVFKFKIFDNDKEKFKSTDTLDPNFLSIAIDGLPIVKSGTDLDFGAVKLINLADPAAAQHAVTVNYLNNQLASYALDSAVIKKDGSVAYTAAQSMGGFNLTNVADPVNPQDAATRAYVLQQVGGTGDFSDSAFRVSDNGDSTKKMAFEVSGIATATVRTVTMPDANVNLADVNNAVLKDGTRAFTADQSMGGFKLTNLADPVSSADAVTLSYMNARLNGLTPKSPVKAASTANLTLSGAQTVDGIALIAGDRVLVKDQSTASENGIYVVAAGAWSRSADMDSLTPIDEVNGAWVAVQQGGQAGQVFVQYSTVATLGTDPLNFSFYNPIAGLIGGDMITFAGSAFSVDLATDAGLESSNPGNVAGQLRVKLNGATLDRSVSGLKVADGGIADLQIASGAAIAYSKLNLTSSIVNADISGSAAIAYSKLALTGAIVNADISASAAIAYSKLALTGAIVNADISASAAIAYSKLALSNSIVAGDLTSLAVTNAKINSNVFDQVTITGGAGVAAAVNYSIAKTNDNAGAITIRQVVYIKANGNVDKAQANISSLGDFALAVVSDASIASAGSGNVVVRRGCIVSGFSGLTPGKKQYVSRSTAGALTETLTGFVAGESAYCVGRAISATELLFDPQFEFEFA